MSYAICYNLDPSKILSSSNGLTLYQTTKMGPDEIESICKQQNKHNSNDDLCP